MVKQSKKLVVLGMAGLMAFSNIMPVFASSIGNTSSSIVNPIEQNNVFKAANIEWNFKHDIAKYMKYYGGSRDASNGNFMVAFGADNTVPGNVYGESYVIMLRADVGTDLGQLGLDNKTVADVMGQTLVTEFQKAYEDSIKKAGKTPVFGSAASTFQGKYDANENWFYTGMNMGVTDSTNSARMAVVGTVKGTKLYLILVLCDGTSTFGKAMNVDTFTDIKVTGDQIVSNPFNGVIANTETDINIGNASLDAALGEALTGNVSGGATTTTPSTPTTTVSGTSQVSAKGHTYVVPSGAKVRDASGYLYWNKADQVNWVVNDSQGGRSSEVSWTFADSAAFNDNTWDSYNTPADLHTYYKNLIKNVFTDRVNTVETLTDSRGRNWTVYYSIKDGSYGFGAAINDNIDGVAVVVECTLYNNKSKSDVQAYLASLLGGVK